MAKLYNQLQSESSPYLLQHAENPVNWYPWGDEALDKARDGNKLIIVSIGYSACHWCHVMEKESFEDQEVAEVMNRHFISIKVDREERPDIDQVYMNAIQLITGQGGWPLNCIALPDGSPVYGGTYFPKPQWVQVLETLSNIWENDPQKLQDQAEQLKQGIQETDLITSKKEEDVLDREELKQSVNRWKHKFDAVYGGEDYAPKFPMPNNYQFLLDFAMLVGDFEARDHVLFTLEKMASGGIYDHLRGGFARYSVDRKWLIPHFEKMLYDNAQLVSLYSQAYQLTKNKRYKEVVFQTLEFVKRELSSPEHGFYSALDADSEGEEGKYYSWRKPEITGILGTDTELFCAYYGITETGNWEHGKNILHVENDIESLSKTYNLSADNIETKIIACREQLFEYQNKRIRPSLDDKILTSWNALMLKGFTDAYRVFGEPHFLDRAIKNAEFIKNHLINDDYRLDRSYKNGISKINAFLDDYAFLIEAYISLYEVTFEEKWMHLARGLVEFVDDHFPDEKSGMYYYTSRLDRSVVTRKMELSDNVIPASNSVMAKNLFKMASFFENVDHQVKSRQMLNNMVEHVYKHPKFYSNWATLLLWFSYTFHEVVFCGRKALQMQKEWNQHFIPNQMMAGSVMESDLPLLKDRWQGDETYIYVCRNNTCQLPVKTVEEALQQFML